MRALKDLPGPQGLPLVGNALSIRPTTLQGVAESWSERYGSVYRFKIGPNPVVAISDGDLIKAILRERPHQYRRWRVIAEVSEELNASGVLAAEGDSWRRQRRLAIRALNVAHLTRYFDVIAEAGERLLRRLDAVVRSGESLNIDAEFSAYTIDVTAALAFGLDLKELDAEEALAPHLKQMFDVMARRLNAPVPYWRYVRLPSDRRVDHSVAVIERAVAGFVAAARTRIQKRPELAEHPENFLESMLGAQQVDPSLDDRTLVGNVVTMLLAGEDTTSHTLAWASWLMATEPDAQARLAAEADAALGKRRTPGDHPTVDRLVFTEAFIQETLRLRPAAPLIFIEPIADVTVADLHIPAGTRLLLLGRPVGLREENFAEPGAFRPERWLDGFEGVHDGKAQVAFGAGPRFCPGRNLALLEAKTALAIVARNFEVSLVPGSPPVRERSGFTMSPASLHIQLRPRSRTRD